MALGDALTRGASNPIIARGGSGAWDEGKLGPLNIVKVAAGDYRMWYEGYGDPFTSDILTRIGYATSSDGTTWTKYGSNPIFAPTETWEQNEVSPGTVMYDSDAGVWKMWYHGGHNLGPRNIGYATSSDGIAWTRGNSSLPVLEEGTTGQWDAAGVADACVMRVASNDYRMWFKGESAGGVAAVGYATSTDGVSWSKSGSNPIFQNGAASAWDDDFVHNLWVMKIGQDPRFHGWYSGRDISANDGGVGYAWSWDGIVWTRGASNPVLAGLSTEEISDPAFAYVDGNDLRVVYYYEDFGSTPVERDHGEATGSLVPGPLMFAVTASGDDGHVQADDPSYPPPAGETVDTSAADITARKAHAFSAYRLSVPLIRFDTSAIPDGATITEATLRVWVTNKWGDSDNRSLSAGWYNTSNWPIDTADYTSGDATDAHAGTDLTGISAGASLDLALTNLSNISKTGYTGLRLTITGGAPTVGGENNIEMASFDHATLPEPLLLVTYTEAAAPTPNLRVVQSALRW